MVKRKFRWGVCPHPTKPISFLVSHQPQLPVANQPLALLKALFANPAARMFCYGLWNDTETAVAYNRELLGLDALWGNVRRKR